MLTVPPCAAKWTNLLLYPNLHLTETPPSHLPLRSPLLLLLPVLPKYKQIPVISTEDAHSPTVRSEVDKPASLPKPSPDRDSAVALAVAFAVAFAVACSPEVQTNPRHFDRRCSQSHRAQRSGQTCFSTQTFT